MRFIKSARYSTVGVFFAGIIAVIQGCSLEKEGALFAVLLLILQFCSAPVEETTTGGAAPATLPIILYDSGYSGKGDLGPRFGDPSSTKICEDSTKKPAGYTRFIALLSYTLDAVVDFPKNVNVPGFFDATVPVIGPSPGFFPIGDNWADLLDDSIINRLSFAIPGGPSTYWTGTLKEGTESGDNCSDWTQNGGVLNDGTFGFRTSNTRNWIDAGITSCGNDLGFICVAY